MTADNLGGESAGGGSVTDLWRLRNLNLTHLFIDVFPRGATNAIIISYDRQKYMFITPIYYGTRSIKTISQRQKIVPSSPTADNLGDEGGREVSQTHGSFEI